MNKNKQTIKNENIMDRLLHFWYSSQTEHNRQLYGTNIINYAIIDGKEVRYTCCSENIDSYPFLKDKIYLGCGYYSRSEKG